MLVWCPPSFENGYLFAHLFDTHWVLAVCQALCWAWRYRSELKGYRQKPPLLPGGEGSLLSHSPSVRASRLWASRCGHCRLLISPGNCGLPGSGKQLGQVRAARLAACLTARPPAPGGIAAWDLSSSEGWRQAVGKSSSDSGHQFC